MPDPSYLDLATMPDPRILGLTIIFDVRPRRDLTPYMAAIPKKIELSMFFRLQSIGLDIFSRSKSLESGMSVRRMSNILVYIYKMKAPYYHQF